MKFLARLPIVFGWAFLVLEILIVLARAAPAPARMLEAKIEHSEFLRPIEDELTPGHIYDNERFTHLKPQRLNFYEIPDWLVGTWQYDAMVTTSVQDYRSGQSSNYARARVDRGTDYQGNIRDGRGHYWNADLTPYVAVSDAGDRCVYFLTKEYYPIENSVDKITMRVLSLDVEVNKASGKIISVFETENFQTYTPEAGDLVRMDKSEKTFDLNGRPSDLIVGYATMKRVGGYRPCADASLAKRFALFLEKGAQNSAAQ